MKNFLYWFADNFFYICLVIASVLISALFIGLVILES